MQERKKPTPGRPQGAKTFDPAPALAFGSAVKARRLELGISQETLAGAAQVERSHIGKVERGEHMPNFVLITQGRGVLLSIWKYSTGRAPCC